MFFTTSMTKQWIYNHLQHSHANPDGKQRQKGCRKSCKNCKYQSGNKCQNECSDQHGFLGVLFNQYSRWNRHNAICNKKRKWQKTRETDAEIEAVNDIRNEWPQDVCKK